MNREALENMRKEADEVLRSERLHLTIVEHELWRFLHNLIVSILEEDKENE